MKTKIVTLALALTAMFGASITAHADAVETFNSSLTNGVYWGGGNQNSGFDVLSAKNTDGSTLELGLSGFTRFVGAITPATNDYFYSPGVGVGPNAATWDFAYSVNTGTDKVSAYSYSVTITDTTTFKSFSFDPTWINDNASPNDGSNGFQNAENLGFAWMSGPLNFNASAADTYNITLSALPRDGAVDPSISINLIPTSATPEPSSLVLLGTGLLGFAGAMRKRFAS